MNKLGGYEFADLRIGMSATFAKTITEADIVLFAAVSGDNNALHINAEYAATTIFETRIAHGMLSASVISAAIANKLPGPGSIYLSQSLRFRAPVAPAIPFMPSSRSRSSSPSDPACCSARNARCGESWSFPARRWCCCPAPVRTIPILEQAEPMIA